MALQKAVLKTWSLFDPSIKLVLFTDSEYWKERAREVGVTWTDAFEWLCFPLLMCRLNSSNLPFFTSMTEYLQNHYLSHFYGYVNGDILFHTSLHAVLRHVADSFPEQSLLIVGRRYNHYFNEDDLSLFTSQLSIDDYIASAVRYSEQFSPVAQAYFLFTENTLTKQNVLPVVVGRNRYDNYLLTVCKTSFACQLIDASEASRSVRLASRVVIALHLSDANGDFAGTKAKTHADWNVRLIGAKHQFNSVAFADWKLCRFARPCSRADRFQSGVVRHAKNSFVNDDFAQPAVDFLRKYLAPGTRCVYFGQSNVGGVLMTEFRDISVVSVVSDKWFQ